MFSDSRKVRSTTFSAKTLCLVCPISTRWHPSFTNGFLAPYIVGMNPNSPQNPHSAMASGGNDTSKINTLPPVETYVLYGGVVGGPDKQDKYYDIRDDWPQTGVTLLSPLFLGYDSLKPSRRSLLTTMRLSSPLPPCMSWTIPPIRFIPRWKWARMQRRNRVVIHVTLFTNVPDLLSYRLSLLLHSLPSFLQCTSSSFKKDHVTKCDKWFVSRLFVLVSRMSASNGTL